MTAAFIRRLTLSNFRSYHAAQVRLDRPGPVVLTGANGAGKTNLIEAISLLAPGRGLRRGTMEELAFSEGDGAWAISAEIEGMLGLATLGTGIDPPAGEESTPTRKCRIDRESVLGGRFRRPSAWCGSPRHGPASSTGQRPNAGASLIVWSLQSMRSIQAASPRSGARLPTQPPAGRRAAIPIG
jgi:hypothetical protein